MQSTEVDVTCIIDICEEHIHESLRLRHCANDGLWRILNLAEGLGKRDTGELSARVRHVNEGFMRVLWQCEDGHLDNPGLHYCRVGR